LEEDLVESLGERLKTARERKGCTFDQISRDTNIARRYLEALESEDFGQFPGEPYLLGFLRNYGDYLGLDTQELITSYRTLKIQEQPVPVEQLLKDQRSSPSLALLGIVGAIAVVAIGLVVFLVAGRASGKRTQAVVERKPAQYELTSGFMEKRLYQGDSVLVTSGSERFKLELTKLGDSVTIQAPGGDVVLDLGQEGSVDLNGDGMSELKLFVADLFKNDPSKGAALRLELSTGAAATAEAPAATPSETPSVAAAAAPAETPVVASTTGAPVIFSSPNPYPFTLQATFKGYCMFRWEADRKEREERYFHKAETLNVQAQNGIRLWVSNAGAVKLQAIGGGKTVDVEIGGSGEVVVTDLKWVKDEDGRFKLTTVRLD
jgi:cytoskeleton protein RodZ